MTIKISDLQPAFPLIRRLEELDKMSDALDADDGKTPETGAAVTIAADPSPRWSLSMSADRVAAARELAREELDAQRADVLAQLKTLGVVR